MLKVQMISLTIKRYYILCVIVACIVVYTIYKRDNVIYEEHKHSTLPTYPVVPITRLSNSSDIIKSDPSTLQEIRNIIMKERIQRLERKYKKSQSIILNSKPILQPNYNVHIFYYAWYSNPKVDAKYKHWNHEYLQNWKKDDHKKYPTGRHTPPYDIGSNYYPYLGPYSSADPKVIDTHLKQLYEAKIGVIVISWRPPNYTDSPSEILPHLFNTALKYNMKISLHIEPYVGRNPINLVTYLTQFFIQYLDHPALYKIKKPLGEKMLPVIYIYDSYLIPATAWKELFSEKGNLSVRNTAIDAIYLGLLVDVQHKYHIKKSQFDGFYTYFATNSFTYGSSWKNWKSLSKFALQNGLIFAPSVGPGYIDLQVRPWNSINTRHRHHGRYYDIAWRAALNNYVNYVSITSFNEWHEGTQIEPATPMTSKGFSYLDYEPEGPFYYLNSTKSWIGEFEKMVGLES